MYRFFILIALQLIGYGSIIGQEFLFSIIFNDTLANSDTLELGYDETGSEALDS
ncbi:MAG: hypothetical protein OEQ53_01090 [Saprospiraceae bacterium]|nr:hypothetical protein [Saprospiraceae bacterium]